MLYCAVRFLGKSNLRDFEVDAHFLLEARKKSRLDVPWWHFLEASHGSGRGFPAGFRLRYSLFRRQLGPPAPRPAFEDMAVVEEAVEHGGDGRAVTQ